MTRKWANMDAQARQTARGIIIGRPRESTARVFTAELGWVPEWQPVGTGTVKGKRGRWFRRRS